MVGAGCLPGGGVFILGSALCGLSQNMIQLIIFRALQGLGSGAVLPITITIIGDIFSFEERARMQGLFSSVWGVSAIIGPALGGVIVDFLDWRWIFYINLPIGLVSIVMLLLFLKEEKAAQRPRVDYAGAAALATGITLLLLALLQGGTTFPWGSPYILGLLALATLALVVFCRIETRVSEPMLPFSLFREKIIGLSLLANFLIGAVMIGASTYVPMFVQGVMGGSAVNAGAALAPMSIGWPLGSTICGRLLLRVGYRKMTTLGMVFQVLSIFMLLTLSPGTGQLFVSATSFVMGLGLGFCSTSLIVIVQSVVEWNRRGIATAAVQFMRTLGSTCGVAVSAVILNNVLLKATASLGMKSFSISTVNRLMDPVQRHLITPEQLANLKNALSIAIHSTFWLLMATALAGLATSFLLPRLAPRQKESNP